MEKQPINKNVDEKDLEETFQALLNLEKKLLQTSKLILNQETEKGKLFKSSHYILSIINRTISLNRGFITLFQANNYSTAISLIRLQLDSCLRLYAPTLTSNWLTFFQDVSEGKEIRNLKDREGKKMTDAYLIDKFDELENGFKLLYKNTCGFVHFSNTHYQFSSKIKEQTEDKLLIQFSVGNADQLNIHEKVDYSYNMFRVTKSIYLLLKDYQKVIKEHWL